MNAIILVCDFWSIEEAKNNNYYNKVNETGELATDVDISSAPLKKNSLQFEVQGSEVKCSE